MFVSDKAKGTLLVEKSVRDFSEQKDFMDFLMDVNVSINGLFRWENFGG